ncbi:MAG: hypothetical protein RIT81_32245 [Deltaproteobacteria bacterium]
MAIGKTPNTTQQLLAAAKIQVDAFADSGSLGGRQITWQEMNAIKSAFDADPATARAMDGGPTTYAKEAREGLAKLLGGKAMEPAARATFLRMMGALPDTRPGDEIVALYAVAIRRAAEEVRADPSNPEKLAMARMLSAHAAATLTPVAPVAMTTTAGTGIQPPPGRGATVFSTASAADAMRGSSETRQGVTASVEALKDLNAAIQGN